MNGKKLVLELAQEFADLYEQKDLQAAGQIGKRYFVTTPDDFFEKYGEPMRLRFSKRKGWRGCLKDGRKIRIW